MAAATGAAAPVREVRPTPGREKARKRSLKEAEEESVQGNIILQFFSSTGEATGEWVLRVFPLLLQLAASRVAKGNSLA